MEALSTTFRDSARVVSNLKEALNTGIAIAQINHDLAMMDGTPASVNGCAPISLISVFGAEAVPFSQAVDLRTLSKAFDVIAAQFQQNGIDSVIVHSSSSFVVGMEDESTVGGLLFRETQTIPGALHIEAVVPSFKQPGTYYVVDSANGAEPLRQIDTVDNLAEEYAKSIVAYVLTYSA